MIVTRKTWGGGKEASEVVLVEIEGGGHTWPGQKPILTVLCDSTMDISANDLMLHEHAAEFGGDADRIFIIGISAGAHLAAVVSTNERFLAKHQKALGIIKGAVILDIGSFDIPALMKQAGERAPDMYRYTFRSNGNQEDWVDCSPIYHVKRGKNIPPMLLYFVAGRDHHAMENERFAASMKEEGFKATVLAAERKTHLRIELEIGISGDRPTAEILRFLEKENAKAKS